MSDKQRLLDKLQEMPTADSAQEMVVPYGEGQLRCCVVAVEQLAAVFEQIAYCRSDVTTLQPPEIQKIGSKLADRLQYLLEPIAPIEIDQKGAVLQMRSLPPSDDGQSRSYYELLVRSSHLSLQRFRVQDHGSRQPAKMTVTYEILARLADDLSAAYS